MIHYTDFLGRDNRNSFAILRYILTRCCSYKKEHDSKNVYRVYQNLDFMQLKWIIDRCNFLSGKWYGLKFLDYDLLDWINESDLVPETFNCDWGVHYATNEYDKILLDEKRKPVKIKSKFISKEEDYLSGADIAIMNKVIRRWKIYGKISVIISEWWYKSFMKK